MPRKLLFKNDGINNSIPPIGYTYVGSDGQSFVQKNSSGESLNIDNFEVGGPLNISYSIATASVEYSIYTMKVPANTYKVGQCWVCPYYLMMTSTQRDSNPSETITYRIYTGSSEFSTSNQVGEETQSHSYWSSSQGGLTTTPAVSGFGPGAWTRIKDKTTVEFLSEVYDSGLDRYYIQYNTVSIPDVTEDFWITLTAETTSPVDMKLHWFSSSGRFGLLRDLPYVGSI